MERWAVDSPRHCCPCALGAWEVPFEPMRQRTLDPGMIYSSRLELVERQKRRAFAMPDQGLHSRLPSGRDFHQTEFNSFADLRREYRRYRTTRDLQASRAMPPWLPLLPATYQAKIPAFLGPSPGGISYTGTRRGARIMPPENRCGSWPPFLPLDISGHLRDGMSNQTQVVRHRAGSRNS